MKLLLPVAALLSLSAFADELVLPAKELARMGLRPVRFEKASTARGLPEEMTEWPVVFESREESIAQNYVQHQDYGGGQYYHGGCDLRTLAGSWATAPVSGVLEGGYYGYETRDDGRDVKWWEPWNGNPHPSLYFELAILTADGYRYELHHVDPMTLPEETVRKLDAAGSRVEAGERLAHVATWPSAYHHVHYNIVAPDGVRMNPERFSVPVEDRLAPDVIGVYVPSGRKSIEVREGGHVPAETTELVVRTTESRDGNAYVQTPPYFALELDGGLRTAWDFRTRLTDADGAWVDIRRFFADSIVTPSGRRVENTGNYGVGEFLVRVPVPEGAKGPFTLVVGDTAGNETRIRATID